MHSVVEQEEKGLQAGDVLQSSCCIAGPKELESKGTLHRRWPLLLSCVPTPQLECSRGTWYLGKELCTHLCAFKGQKLHGGA